MSVVESFPISAMPQREGLDHFRSVVDRVFCPMHVRHTGGLFESFRGSIEAMNLGRVRVAKVAGTQCTVSREAPHVARTTDPAYLLKFQSKGESHWSQHGRAVHLRAGDFVICSMAEPYVLTFRGDYEMSVVALTGSTMRHLTSDPERFLGIRMMSEDADCGLLSSFVGQIVARMGRLSEPVISRIEANILDLLGGILSARTMRAALSPTQHLSQIKAFIGNHLHENHLRAQGIAAAFAISTRYLHSLFQQESLSVGRYIRRLRIETCGRMLSDDSAARNRSLTEIAVNCGFYDLSHMSRCFRERYGVTPREFRALHSKVTPRTT
jgi:AraC-like DNA-binding protein